MNNKKPNIITWNDLQIDFEHLNSSELLEPWLWLIGSDKKLILISSIGDMFLADEEKKCYWLNVGEALLEKVADSIEEFETHLKDEEIVRNWFLVELVSALKYEGLELAHGKLYSYKTLPILGGKYNISNFELTDIEVHFELHGQIAEGIKDLPDGTKVTISISE